MKNWLLGCVVCLSAGPIFSQTASPSLEVPQGPLLAAKSADFSAWTATFAYTLEPEEVTDEKYKQALKEMAEQDPVLAKIMAKRPNFAARKPRIARVNVVKTGAVKKEITSYSSGVLSERWVDGNLVVKKDPFQKEIQLNSFEGEDADFPEFAWISAKNYKGTEKMAGQECLVFEDEILQIRVDDPRSYEDFGIVDGELVPVKALIDAKTRLPAALEYTGVRRSYVYGPAPSGTLSLPADLAAEVQKSADRFKARNAPLSPP